LRIAAIDFGFKRIGLAISDMRGIIALPLKAVLAGKTLQQSCHNVLEGLAPYLSETIEIVVGLPVLFNGTLGSMAKSVTEFGTLLEKEAGKPIRYVDERLSSSQAERALKEMQYTRKQRKQHVDSAAASFILQTVLR
jgi:putative holliday junction resolvase